MLDSFARYVQEVRELQDRLRADESIPLEDLDRLLLRLGFLREQIDLSRKVVEGARKGAVQELQRVQEQLDRERSP